VGAGNSGCLEGQAPTLCSGEEESAMDLSSQVFPKEKAIHCSSDPFPV